MRRNLIKRAENAVTPKINHTSFENNCLAFYFAKNKGDEEGNHARP